VPVAYLALGSNLGDRWANLTAAVQRLRREPGLRVQAVSGFYETDPVGGPTGQGKYLNAAAKVETNRTPQQLLDLLLHIEKSLGRVRSVKDAPRTIDLDVLLYDDRVLDTPELTVPHPRMADRAFVLVPLREIAGSVMHPVLKTSIFDLATRFPETLPLQSLPVTTGGFDGLHVLVTGSTSGIGAATAAAFAAAGATVTTHGRSPRPGRHLVADLRDPAQVDRIADEAWGDGLDVLVCNAGADTLTGDAAKWSFDEKLETLLAVDLKATMRLARTIGARMKARGRGLILTVGWDQAETGMDGDSGQLFAAVKGAVMSFTRSLALDLAPEVRVNCLAPGWIRTAWGETASEAWQERVRRETPLGVWGLPEDVAAAAVHLAKPESAFITGQTIRINGGAVRG
jgi:2-amino-4-hydroxy-6-hydroxymethyldihydropteridine diphosphokinase